MFSFGAQDFSLVSENSTAPSSPFETPAFVLLQLQMSDAMDNLEELLRLSGGDGQIFTVEGMLCMKSVQAMFGYDSGEIMGFYHVVMFSIFIRESLRIFVCLKEAD